MPIEVKPKVSALLANILVNGSILKSATTAERISGHTRVRIPNYMYACMSVVIVKSEEEPRHMNGYGLRTVVHVGAGHRFRLVGLRALTHLTALRNSSEVTLISHQSKRRTREQRRAK